MPGLGLGLGIGRRRRRRAAAGSSSSSAAPPDLLTGLWGAWRFDDNLEDSSGNARHFGFGGGASFGPGKLADALIDMSADAVTTASLPDVNEYTIAFWSQGPSEYTETRAVVIANANEYGSYWMLESDGASLVRLRHSTDDYSVGFDSVGLSGAWRHFAIVRGPEADKIRFYVDGALVHTETSYDLYALGDGLSTQLRINATPPLPLDMLLVYTSALPADAVAAMHNGGAGFDPTA